MEVVEKLLPLSGVDEMNVKVEFQRYLDEKDQNRMTPFMLACQGNHLAIMDHELKFNEERLAFGFFDRNMLTTTTPGGWTALCFASHGK